MDHFCPAQKQEAVECLDLAPTIGTAVETAAGTLLAF